MLYASGACGLILWCSVLAGPAGLTDAIPARTADPERTGYDAGVFALQLVLDRAGFGPGLLDGAWGPKTARALERYQASGRTPPAQALEPYAHFTIGPEEARQVGRVPRTWTGKARVGWLPYPSLLELLVERTHCTASLLARLNPGLDLSQLRTGTTLVVPDVTAPPLQHPAESVRIYLREKVIAVHAGDGTCMACFPCSIAADPGRRPVGRFRVVSAVPYPWFTFNPRVFREVRGIRRKLQIPPGPRSPVGVWWIGLSKPGYGIHGTPRPQDIGKTGSHGCFRLANWDVDRLAPMVRGGTPVIILPGLAHELAHSPAERLRR